MPYKLSKIAKGKLTALFDIERYFDCDKLDTAGWYGQLSRRMLVKERLQTSANELPEFAPSGKDLILDILEKPLKKTFMADEARRFKPAVEDTEGREIFFYRTNVKNIIVDLRATDEQLISDFKDWLASKREELYRNKKSQDNYTKIGKKELQEWYHYDVLAYIDLILYGLAFKQKLPNPFIGKLLFGDRAEPDPAEQIRKVLKPKADKLLTYNALAALAHQAGRIGRSANTT